MKRQPIQNIDNTPNSIITTAIKGGFEDRMSSVLGGDTIPSKDRNARKSTDRGPIPESQSETTKKEDSRRFS